MKSWQKAYTVICWILLYRIPVEGCVLNASFGNLTGLTSLKSTLRQGETAVCRATCVLGARKQNIESINFKDGFNSDCVAGQAKVLYIAQQSSAGHWRKWVCGLLLTDTRGVSGR